MLRAILILLLLTVPAFAAAPVSAVAYRPDGKLLAASTRGEVALIDPAKGEVVADLTGLPGRVTAVAFSANHLAVACGEPGKAGVVRLYEARDPKTAKSISEFTAHKDAIYGLAFSPDGTTLATASYDKLVKLWSVGAKPVEKLALTDHSDAVYAVAFHPSGKLLATGSADRAVKVWDTATGKRLYTLSDPTDWVYAVAWNHNGTRLAAGGTDKSLRVWDVNAEGGKLVGSAFAHGRGVSRLAYSADGKVLASLGEDRVVKTWDAAKLTEIRTYPAQSSDVLAFALKPDAKQFAVGRFDGVLQLIDTATGKPTVEPLKPKPPTLSKVSQEAFLRGKVARVTFEGAKLDEATRIVSEPAGVVAKLVESSPTKLVAEVTCPEGLPIGAVRLSVESAAGPSNAVKVWVDRFPVITERGTNDSARQAPLLPLPETVVGSLDRAGDTDFYRFEAKAGQQLGVQVTTEESRARFDPVVILTDEGGSILAEGADGLLGFVCLTAGTYCVGIRDREYRGGKDYAYRAHVGPVPIVTGVFPLSVKRGDTTEVRVSGVNLPGGTTMMVKVSPSADAAIGSKLAVPIPRKSGDVVGAADVTVGEFPEITVTGSATLPSVPGSADGLLAKPGESHTIRFRAKKGQPLVIETHAARLGAPTDTFLEVLDAAGKPVQRAVLRCTAKTFVTFRDHSSSSTGIRLEYWNELAIDDFLFVGTDLMRIKALPKGPDDDAQFYEVDGKRVGYLGTTPTYHAMGTPMYKVEQHPPGSTFPPNGMPLFPMYFRNDDGGASFGKDSRIAFDPPADGEYTVRVSDANGEGGPTHAYRLTVRPPRPDFTVRVRPSNPQVWKGGAIPVTVTAARSDGFEGPIAVRVEGLVAPFAAPPTVIEARQNSAVFTLACGKDAMAQTAPVRVIATATIDGKDITREATIGTPKAIEPGDLVTTVSVTELAIRPGAESRVVLTIERRNGHTGRVPLEVRNLPHGVRVLNIGLNGILVLPGQTEREVVIYAEPWVQPMEREILFSARSERKNTEHAAPAVMLKVRK